MNWDTLTLISRYATPEVITVFGAIFTAWLGWKVAAKGIGLVSGMAQKVSFLGLTAAILAITGLGGMGVGFGELASHRAEKQTKIETNVENEMLVKIAEKSQTPEIAAEILDYARDRDSKISDPQLMATIRMVKQINHQAMNDKEFESNNRLMIAFLEYLKATKNAEQKLVTLNRGVSFQQNDFGSPVTLDPPEILEKVPLKSSMMSYSQAYALIGIGFGAFVCAIVCHNRRQHQIYST